jgi:hypothetical protein
MSPRGSGGGRHRLRRHCHVSVAEAIADGARTVDPTSEVACVRVAEADLEVVRAADLLVVGGPTHIRGMTSGMSRRMGLTAEEKKDETEQHEIEPGADGPGVRDWFADLPKAAKGNKPPRSTPAGTPGWRVEQLTGLLAGCATSGTT